MDLLDVKRIPETELLSSLKSTRLRGFGSPQVYASASLELKSFDPSDLTPAQRYVLRSGTDQVLALREALLPFGIDVFKLRGGAVITAAEAPHEKIPVIPPIVEESLEPDGRRVLIINDGIHRVFAARSCGERITVVLARNVPVEYPYYALALPNGWADVVQLDELPDSFEKKAYRDPDNYKALFRDFNAVFPGVQKQRKRSNPAQLRA